MNNIYPSQKKSPINKKLVRRILGLFLGYSKIFDQIASIF